MTLRKISIPSATKTPAQQKAVQERYFVRLVKEHPKYRMLLASLREGVKATEIAAHFAENGWLHVNERTFIEAIRVYKNVHPEAIENADIQGLDTLVDPNQPGVTLQMQMQQLLRLQRVRLGLGHNFEKTTNMPSQQVTKDLEIMTKMVETLGKLDGKIVDGTSNKMGGEEHSVIENLNRVKRDQTTRDRLHSAVKQLVEVKGG